MGGKRISGLQYISLPYYKPAFGEIVGVGTSLGQATVGHTKEMLMSGIELQPEIVPSAYRSRVLTQTLPSSLTETIPRTITADIPGQAVVPKSMISTIPEIGLMSGTEAMTGTIPIAETIPTMPAGLIGGGMAVPAAFGIGGGWGFPFGFGMLGKGGPPGWGRGVSEWTVVNPLRDLWGEWQAKRPAQITSKQKAQQKLDSMFGTIGKLTDETARLKTRGSRQPQTMFGAVRTPQRFVMPTMLQQSA